MSAEPIDTSTLGPIKCEPVTWAEHRAAEATKERFKHRLATEDQRNGYEVGYYEALIWANANKLRGPET